MTHQEILERLSSVSETPIKELAQLAEALPTTLADLLKADESLTIPGFGTFEVHKRLERVVENPATGRRTLTPPQLILRFRKTIALHPKYTLHDLSDKLAKKCKIKAEESLQFVAQCFGTLYEGLQTEGFASLMGFGTFRMETIAEAERPQTTFTPDESLATLINRPFAELPTVELNAATDLRELEAVNAEFTTTTEESQQPLLATTTEEIPIETETPSTKAELPSTEAEKITLETEESVSPVPDVPTMPQDLPPEPIKTDTSATRTQIINDEEETTGEMHWRRAAIVFGVAFLALLLFVLLRWGRIEAPAPSAVIPKLADTLVVDTLAAKGDSTQIIPLDDPAEVFTSFEPDGVLCEHTVKFGDILIHLAEHYYGNPYFVKFIIEYNGLPASGEAAPGTVLRIPHLHRKAGM